ncbi:MAG: hypothetical protein QCI00_06215 [Candidatus Thermoplasmatota archaeon]|nr:hypothetical protein [Candidatus Thermoplasmatota archaeon]
MKIDKNIESEIKKAVETLVKYVDYLTDKDLTNILLFAGETLEGRYDEAT